MPKTITAPEIEKLKLTSLTIDNKYSGRSEKEITDNAKEKAKELEAFGGWNPAMPGQYFIGEDGEKHLLAGFSRVKASLMNGYDTGYFVRVEGEEIDYLLACETTNSTRPLSALSRGARYSELLQGVISDDFAGTIADKKNPKDWKRMPMSKEEIGERVGKTGAWVGRCITIFEAPPEIRDMLETEKIATSVADEARKFVEKHHEGNEVKQVAMCRKAFCAARAEGKDTATKQHFAAIKDEFLPVKKQVADRPEDEKGKNKPAKGSSSPATGSDDAEKDDTAELPAGDSGSEPDADLEEPQNELFEHAADVTTEGTDKNTKLRAAWKTILMEPDNLEETTLDEETVDALVEKLHAAMIAARDVF